MPGATMAGEDVAASRAGITIAFNGSIKEGKAMWHSGNYIELNILKRDAQKGYHQGRCDKDIEGLLEEPYIKKQFDRIDPQKIVKELSDYGAWDEEELKDEQANRARVLWLFCGDIVDNH